MSYSRDEVRGRGLAYAGQQDLVLLKELGFGVHGIVWATNKLSAVKVHAPYSPHYIRERDVYLRLAEHRVTKLRGFRIPRLHNFDDARCAIEMGVVSPPYAIDFAGTYLDSRPDFSEEALDDQEAANRELFGSQWPEVKQLLAALAYYGIYVGDVSPRNIRCREEVVLQ